MINDMALQQAFDSVNRFYLKRDIFRNAKGFGKRPALVILNIAYGWTDPAYASGSLPLDETVQAINTS